MSKPPNRQTSVFALASGILLFVMAGSPVARGEDAAATKPLLVHKTVNGIIFNVPEDWPIEERDGATAPIPVEEYLAMKFRVLESRLRIIERRFSGLDIRLRILEQGRAGGQGAGLRSSERPRP